MCCGARALEFMIKLEREARIPVTPISSVSCAGPLMRQESRGIMWTCKRDLRDDESLVEMMMETVCVE